MAILTMGETVGQVLTVRDDATIGNDDGWAVYQIKTMGLDDQYGQDEPHQYFVLASHEPTIEEIEEFLLADINRQGDVLDWTDQDGCVIADWDGFVEVQRLELAR